MSKQPTRKRRKPTNLDKQVYMDHGMRGHFKVEDLFESHETLDFDNLEVRSEPMDKRAADRTLDLLVKYRKEGIVPAGEWNEAVAERELGLIEEGRMMTFTTDEIELSEGDLSSDSSDDVLSTRIPQRIDWARYSSADLKSMPPIAFCGVLTVDGEIDMTLESLVGKRKPHADWQVFMGKAVKAVFRSMTPLGNTYSVMHFQLRTTFLALYLDSVGMLINYFHVKAVEQ